MFCFHFYDTSKHNPKVGKSHTAGMFSGNGIRCLSAVTFIPSLGVKLSNGIILNVIPEKKRKNEKKERKEGKKKERKT